MSTFPAFPRMIVEPPVTSGEYGTRDETNKQVNLQEREDSDTSHGTHTRLVGLSGLEKPILSLNWVQPHKQTSSAFAKVTMWGIMHI